MNELGNLGGDATPDVGTVDTNESAIVVGELTAALIGDDTSWGADLITRKKTVSGLAASYREAQQKITELSNSQSSGTQVESQEGYSIPEGFENVGEILRTQAFDNKLTQEQFAGVCSSVGAAVNQSTSDQLQASKTRMEAWQRSAREKYGIQFEGKMLTIQNSLDSLPAETAEALTATGLMHEPAIRDLLLTMAEEMGGDRLVEHIQEGKTLGLPNPDEAEKRMNAIHRDEVYQKGASNPDDRGPEWDKLHAELMNCGRAMVRGR